MKRLLSLVVALSVLFCLQGCSENQDETPTDEAVYFEENIINLQMRNPDTLDPIATKRQSVRDALLTIYEPLFNINEKFELENVLAQSYAFNENATVMTLKIKEGVTWHNGQPFSSEDVVYTVNKIKKTPDSSYYLNLKSVDRAEKHGDTEVVFYLNKPNAFLTYCLYFPIVKAENDCAENVVGTGAYMFKESDGKSLVLTRNENWHNGIAGCDGIKFLYMRTGEMAQEAFSAGKIHAVTKEMLDIENFAIKESHNTNIYPGGLFEFIGFNSKRGLFTDPLMRIALSNAVDRNAIAEVFGGGIAAGFPIMPGSGAFSPSYETAEYNLDYAKEVIFSAGWRDLDYDLKPEKESGGEIKEMEFELLTADSDNLRNNAAQELKNEIEMAGFTVNIVTVDVETYNEIIKSGDYEAFLGAVYYDAPYDVNNLLSSGGSVNYSYYSSAEMDVALAEFSSATDAQKASVAFSKLQSLYAAYQPIAGLIFRTTYVLTLPYVEEEISPYPYSPYANIAKWKLIG